MSANLPQLQEELENKVLHTLALKQEPRTLLSFPLSLRQQGNMGKGQLAY